MTSRQYPSAPVIGVGGVVLEGTRVLLVRRGHEPMKGEWSLPGGRLELGETLRDGVVREVAEETGLRVEPVKMVEVLDRMVRDEDGKVRYHYVLVDFLCQVKSGRLRAASDAEAVRWVEREDLREHEVAAFTMAVIEKGFAMAQETPGR